LESAFHAVYPLLGALSGAKVAKGKERFFSLSGKNCDIDFPGKWKVFSIRAISLVPRARQFMTNPHGLSGSTFGIPIAKEGVSDWNAADPLKVNMAQDIQTLAITKNPWSLQKAHFAWGSALIGILMAAVYYRVLAKLVVDWWQIPDFSHGFLVPIFAAYLVWAKRKTLVNTKVAPTWSGVAVVALGLVVLLLGVYGAELFLSRISLVILLAGLVLSFGGWHLLKELRFPLLVLVLAIPIPAIVFNEITIPLQILASKLASALLPLFGVPVLREGNIIELSAMKLEVAEACSGIRSLISLFTLAIFYGYFLEKSSLRRAVLAVASIPIAIAANAVRLLGTGLCVQYWDPDKALGFFHEFSGWVMFLVSLGCLFIVHRVMCLFPAKRRQP
jgi:exosortase